MNILVFNCGSSSLNYKIFAVQPPGGLSVAYSGKAHRVGAKGTEPSFIQYNHNQQVEKQVVPIPDHRTAAVLILHYIEAAGIPIDAVGHRIVHGGPLFKESTFLNEQNMPQFLETLPLAPLHNPSALQVYEVCQNQWPGKPQYLSFDTAFHANLPAWAYTYSLPEDVRQTTPFRRYGFHGLSYQYVTHEVASYLGQDTSQFRMVACHLGTGGSSVAAIQNGRSIDTSMGFTPLAGLMMSTRTGDLDPMVPIYLMRTQGLDGPALDKLCNKKSGLLGVSGFSSDLRDIVHALDQDNSDRARLAFDLYTYRLRKTIGAYIALLGGIDVLVFTDDIGVQNSRMRESACQGLKWAGVSLDPALNQAAPVNRIADIGDRAGRVRVLTVPTDEELVIGREGLKLLQEAGYVHY